MEWKKLLRPYRLYCEKDKVEKSKFDARSVFERDFDRIIFSTGFRRLQGKTQVHPIPSTDVIHNRLTHSLEVASVGRSLGRIIGNKYRKEDADPYKCSAIVAAACLAHDIGNPPFGHSGEDAISYYFKNTCKDSILSEIDSDNLKDLTEYEGNASGFRLLTHSKKVMTRNEGGLSLTHATLAAFTKYPCSSNEFTGNKQIISEKKYGIFSEDIRAYEEISKILNIPKKSNRLSSWKRHPLSFLTEAADDICYRIMDFEDGYKLKLIHKLETYNCLIEIARSREEDRKKVDYVVDNVIKDDDQKIGYLRAKAINSLIFHVVDVFDKNYKNIMKGDYEYSLVDKIENENCVKYLQHINDEIRANVYMHRPVLEIEASGFEVIGYLLDTFINALITNKNSSRGEKILELMPKQYKEQSQNIYQQLMNIAEFVSCMTDTYAIDMYRMLKGISLPNYTP